MIFGQPIWKDEAVTYETTHDWGYDGNNQQLMIGYKGFLENIHCVSRVVPQLCSGD